MHTINVVQAQSTCLRQMIIESKVKKLLVVLLNAYPLLLCFRIRMVQNNTFVVHAIVKSNHKKKAPFVNLVK